MEDNSAVKTSFNVNPVDSGYIDLLVSKGVYSSRSDFIRTAIKNEVVRNNREIDQLLDQDKETTEEKKYETILGISNINQKYVERAYNNNEQVSLFIVGYINLSGVTDEDKLFKTVKKIKAYGKVKASKTIKDHYGL